MNLIFSWDFIGKKRVQWYIVKIYNQTHYMSVAAVLWSKAESIINQFKDEFT